MTLARWVASGGGIGYFPKAPGTWGSLAAAVVGALLLAVGGRWLLAAGFILATLAGFWAIPHAAGDSDPGWVVIDEVAGMWLAMLPLGRVEPLAIVVAFALFRLLDITKPGPIGMLDRIPGRVGVMGDDLAAGLGAAAVLWVLLVTVLPR